MIAQLNKDYIFARPEKVYQRLLSYFFFEGRPATTKGRWFNPVTFWSLNKAAGANHVSGCENPIFITGTGRSGSTVLGLVLSMHPDTCFLNEAKALWFKVNPNDDLIGSYSLDKARYIMNGTHVNEQISNDVKSIYSAFLRLSRSKRIIDKFPEMIFRIEYLNKIFAEPKYIFLYRNAMETIASTALWSNVHRNHERQEDWWGINNRKWNLLVEQVVPNDEYLGTHIETVSRFTSQADKAAVEWIVTMNRGLKMSIAYPDKILHVKYEDLCENKEAELLRICRFTGLTPDDTFLNFGRQVIREAQVINHIKLHPVLHAPIAELSRTLGFKDHSPSMIVAE